MKRIIATITSLIMVITSLGLSACSFDFSGNATSEEKKEIHLADWTAGDTADGIIVSNGTPTTITYEFGGSADASAISQALRAISYPYVNFNIKADRETVITVRATYYKTDGEKVSVEKELSVNTESKDVVVYLANYGKLVSIEILPFMLSEGSGVITVTKPVATNLFNYGEVVVCTADVVPNPDIGGEDAEGENGGNNGQNTEEENGGSNGQNAEEENGGNNGQNTEEEPASNYGWDGIIRDDCPVPQEDRLCTKYKDYFRIGMAVGYERYASYTDIAGHYNSMTCENEMKMYTIAPGDNFDYKNPEAYDFSKADEMLTYMRLRGKKIRGHALIWGYDCPGWLAKEKNKEVFLDKVFTYCYTVVKHFSEKFGDVIYAWDVVNEAVSDDYQGGIALTQTTKTVLGLNEQDTGCNRMRGTKEHYSDLYTVGGYEHIKTAFTAARAADKKVKLFYNDYNICQEHQKRRAVINLVSMLIEDGVPIDGVGLQSHFSNGYGDSMVSASEEAIKDMIRLAEVTGHPLDIHITELDAAGGGSLADFYGKLFAVYRNYAANIQSVTFWAVADDYTWLGNATPTLFDKYHNKKPAFDAVYNF